MIFDPETGIVFDYGARRPRRRRLEREPLPGETAKRREAFVPLPDGKQIPVLPGPPPIESTIAWK